MELRHLRTIKAIHDYGGVVNASEILNLTQSALSHQIKLLEENAGVPLFIKNAKPLKLSAAGQKLLKLAESILPEVISIQNEFDEIKNGTAGRLHIAIECHACFEWLFPVLENFRKLWPDIDIDIKPGLAFGALPALEKEEVDLVVSSDPERISGISYLTLFDYSPIFVCSPKHRLARKDFIEAKDFVDETLITYPVEPKRLDIFSQILIPAKVEPKAVRPVELTSIILLLVASNRGVSVLPDWVLNDRNLSHDLVKLRLNATGVTRKLYAATRDFDLEKPFIKDFIKLASGRVKIPTVVKQD